MYFMVERPRRTRFKEMQTKNEQQWFNRPHEELVGVVRDYVQNWDQQHSKGKYSPAEIVRFRLDTEELSSLGLIKRVPARQEMESNFYWQLRSSLGYIRLRPLYSRLSNRTGCGTRHIVVL